MDDQPKTIPEMLGFARIDYTVSDRDPNRLFSQESYQAQYLLYEDEADDLLRRHTSHRDIERELNRRFLRNEEYRERILAGYPQTPDPDPNTDEEQEVEE